MTGGPLLYSLPNEILTQIAEWLDQGRPYLQRSDLVQLARTSTKLRPVAEGVLYRSVNVAAVAQPIPISAAVPNDLFQFLRTLLERPDLAGKVKRLYFRTVRRNRAKLYKQDAAGVDLNDLRGKCVEKLKDLGYDGDSAWYNMVNAFIESAYAGLLFALVPNVEDLKMTVLDHPRGDPCTEPILAMYGTATLPDFMLPTIRNIKWLSILADHFPILSLDFANLTTLDLEHMSTRDFLRLNGPNSLRGASKIETLHMELVIQVAEDFASKHLDARFSDLLVAMGSPALRCLEVDFYNESCRCPEGHDIVMNDFIKELNALRSSLKHLTLDFDEDDSIEDQKWILKNTSPLCTLKNFTALESLAIPEQFLLDTESEERSINEILPASLEQLEILAPKHEIMGFLEQMADNRSNLPEMKRLALQCRDYNANALDFWSDPNPMWNQLIARGISPVVACLDTGTVSLMPVDISDDDTDSDEDENDSSDSDGSDDDGTHDDDDDNDDDDSIPDLESVSGDIEVSDAEDGLEDHDELD